MIIVRRGPVRIAEVWFDENPSLESADVVRFFQRSSPVCGAHNSPFATPRIDLTAPAETLFQALGSDTRYKVRRAESRDGVRYEAPSVRAEDGALREFASFYDSFARIKGQPRLSRPRLRAYVAAGVLDLSVAKDESGDSLVWHAHYRGGDTARLLHSASHFRLLDNSHERNRIGRVNRYHHWRDMLRFKDEGLAWYDLGGWYTGTTDDEQLRINSFKREFGGTVVDTFDAQRSLTLRGALFLLAARLKAGVGGLKPGALRHLSRHGT